MKKLVIFDLDGTLLNTIADLAAATNQALVQLGFPMHKEEAYLQFVGNGIYKLFERALPEQNRSAEDIARVKELFVPYYNAHGTDLTVPYAGITELLETLQQRGIKLAVASNKYQAATSELIAHYFPTISFTAVYGQREGFPTKPHPMLVEKICQESAVSSADTLYVGDSEVDMQTAQNAGVQACAVTWGFRSLSLLQSYHPAYVAHKAADILKFL
ncbi:MAG: HAD family hydrolase [Elusimicrobiaceae bacterium]|nr:HAD family hydrolase [Elusimicrobiaceae bacterium]